MNRGFTIAVLVLSVGLAAPAMGAAIYVFDELGNGTTGQGILAPDPGPGGLPLALTYPAPFPVIPGDLKIFEPGNPSLLSDLIRFNPNNTILFYSDLPEGGEIPALADVGFPTAFYGGFASRTETGVEGGFQDLLYFPVPGEPGYPGAYQFISDVPEPASLGLLAAAAGLVLLRTRRSA